MDVDRELEGVFAFEEEVERYDILFAGGEVLGIEPHRFGIVVVDADEECLEIESVMDLLDISSGFVHRALSAPGRDDSGAVPFVEVGEFAVETWAYELDGNITRMCTKNEENLP